jgi:hypothetical protein
VYTDCVVREASRLFRCLLAYLLDGVSSINRSNVVLFASFPVTQVNDFVAVFFLSEGKALKRSDCY